MAELSSQPTSVQSLYGWFRSGKLWVNRRYQRKLVWTLEEKQKLIDSILRKFPIPAVLLAERDGNPGTYEIIDGLQRLHAIASFIETSFPSADNRYFNLEHFPTAKGYSDTGSFVVSDGPVLEQHEISDILDYMLPISMMRNATEEDVNEVFDRINTYGHRLSDQERRQAGVQSPFSGMIRNIACELRGDVSASLLPLTDMPSISIDLPKTRHGYSVRAEDVVWVRQGVLRSTDLRDSMDEQCIADVAACIVKGVMIERSKAALDKIYDLNSPEEKGLSIALEVYGEQRFAQEFKYCIDEIVKTCLCCEPDKLRDVIYQNKTTNPFPSVFALILIAFHELIITEGMKPRDYKGILTGLTNLSERLDTTRRAGKSEERRKNVDTIRGLIAPSFEKAEDDRKIYKDHTTIDVDTIIRRSEIELPHYELKQGLLRVTTPPTEDLNLVKKIAKTICALANNGPGCLGKILIGVADSVEDSERIKEVYNIDPRKVGRRLVVGVAREAHALHLSKEEYFQKWRDGLFKSGLSQPLLDAVMSGMDYNDYFGLGVIIIIIPSQDSLSYLDDEVYWRNGDQTEKAEQPKKIAELARRF